MGTEGIIESIEKNVPTMYCTITFFTHENK